MQFCQFPTLKNRFALLLKFFSNFGRELFEVLVNSFDGFVFLQKRARIFGTNSFNTFVIVRCVARERFEIYNLMRFNSVANHGFFHSQRDGLASIQLFQRDVLIHELQKIQIIAHNFNVPSFALSLFRERADDVVRFESGEFEHWNVKAFEHFLHVRNLRIKIVRRLFSLSFVVFEHFVPEGLFFGIKSDGDLVRPVVLQKMQQCGRKAVHHADGHALPQGNEAFVYTVVGTVHEGIPINEHNYFHILARDSIRLFAFLQVSYSDLFLLQMTELSLSPSTFTKGKALHSFTVGMILPLTEKQGADFFLRSVEAMCGLGFQVFVLAEGDGDSQKVCFELLEKFPHQFHVLESVAKNRSHILHVSDVLLFPVLPSKKMLKEVVKQGIVPVLPEEASFHDFDPQNEKGNAFTFSPGNFWEFLAAVIRASENRKFEYDWENIKKNLAETTL